MIKNLIAEGKEEEIQAELGIIKSPPMKRKFISDFIKNKDKDLRDKNRKAEEVVAKYKKLREEREELKEEEDIIEKERLEEEAKETKEKNDQAESDRIVQKKTDCLHRLEELRKRRQERLQFKSETNAKFKEVRDNRNHCLHRRMLVKYKAHHEAPALAEKKKIL